MKYLLSVLGLMVALTGMPATASEPVKLSLFSAICILRLDHEISYKIA